MPYKGEAFLGQGDGAYQAWEGNWGKVEDVDRDSFQGLVEINKLTTDIFFEEGVFVDYHTILGDGGDEREAVRKAVGIHNFPAESTVDAGQYEKLLEASHVKEQLARSYILKHIKEGATFGLEQWEVDVLATSCRMAGEFDVMCSQWRDEVQHNSLNEQAEKLGFDNQYTVIRQGEDGLEQVSFAEAFEEQVNIITSEWNELADRIVVGEPNDEQLAMVDYLRTYATALGSREQDDLGNLWRDVDRVWLGVAGRLQPIASREYDYYDENGIRVFPDFRLIIANEETELNQPVEATRQAMIKHLGEEFDGVSVYDETKNGMSQIQIFPEGYDVVFAGCLDFQPAGQFLPNEFEIKRKYGIKVFLNLDVSNVRWGLAMELAEKVFPKDFDLFKRVNERLDGVAIHLAGHEIGEPLLDTDEVREGVGSTVFRLLNEDAGTLSITSIMPDRVESGELPEDVLETQVLKLLGVYLRYIDFARGTPHKEPYYKGMGLLGLKRMVDSGFIRFDGDELRVDLSAVPELYALSKRDFREQVEIADSKDQERALAYLALIEEVELIPEVAYLIKAIHPEE